MAHAAIVTVRLNTVRQSRVYVVTISETDVGAADNVPIIDTAADNSPEHRIPKIGTVVMVRSTLTPGTATTINPAIGTAAGWTVGTQADVWANGVAAGHIDVNPLKTYSGGELHWRSVADAGADNTVDTELWIVEGFEF
jgi:hypothetical protein